MNSMMFGMIDPVTLLYGTVILLAVFSGLSVLAGVMFIKERQVGIVVKRFGSKPLPPGHLIALEGEAGYQADTLAPGLYFGYWKWQLIFPL